MLLFKYKCSEAFKKLMVSLMIFFIDDFNIKHVLLGFNIYQ